MILRCNGLKQGGTVIGEQALRNLRKGPGARAAAIKNPDHVKPVVRPVDGTSKLWASDTSGDLGNFAMMPHNQDRRGGHDHGIREGVLFPLLMVVIDFNTERSG